MALFDEFNREYAKYFEADFPARATVGVELKSGALVESFCCCLQRLRRFVLISYKNPANA